MNRITNVLSLTLLILIALVGCGTPPKTHISDVGVYTSLHIRTAQAGYLSSYNADPADNLQRYFASNSDKYKTNHLRMDDMLDNQQRTSGYYQRSLLAMSMNVASLMNAKVGAATNSAATNKVSNPSATNKTDSSAANIQGINVNISTPNVSIQLAGDGTKIISTNNPVESKPANKPVPPPDTPTPPTSVASI